MKRLLTSLVLAGYMPILPNATFLMHAQIASTQVTSTESDLYYTFYGQKIPLSLRSNTIAVSFKSIGSTRSLDARPLHQQLQDALQGGIKTRSTTSTPVLQANVKPLGDRYALVQVPTNTRSSDVIARIQQQTYVDSTLPVLSRQAGDKLRDEAIVLPNEIILSFEPGLAQSQIQALLNRQNLEIVRPLRFTQNRYVVRSRSAFGTQILNLTNRLVKTPGIQSATPNFIQSIQFGKQEQTTDEAADTGSAQRIARLLEKLPQPEGTPLTSNLLPLQWHLDSTPKRGKLLPRTDVHATEAWRNSRQGKEVVVAVIDSVIQWDHPDLIQNTYEVKNVSNPLQGEARGWDFTSPNGGDPDTRLSAEELEQLRPNFQNTFKLSDQDLLKQYPELRDAIRGRLKAFSDRQVANLVRKTIRSETAAEFHGTWSAGVIAAHPQGNQGVLGVAPQAKILPVRVFGLSGEITEDRLIEAISYAASRGATVVNMSLGGLLPSQGLTDQVFKVLDASPTLSIVASAGNESLDGVAFPAAIPGVISVGATSMQGARSFYSSYGGRLDVVAPGGETQPTQQGGILTTGGTGAAGFWEGLQPPDLGWNMAFDPQGNYVQVQGTSFSAPIVSGVVALMQGERNGKLKRGSCGVALCAKRIATILKQTASYQSLQMSSADATQYRLQAAIGFGTAGESPYLRPSGIFPQPRPVSAEQYFFGNGLVNAAAAVKAAKRG